jgi:hypothetical protein
MRNERESAMHYHEWTATGYLLLEPPTLDGFADRLTTWHCQTCPLFITITGHILLGAPLATPEFWDRMAAQEQRQATPTARQARHEQRIRAGDRR